MIFARQLRHARHVSSLTQARMADILGRSAQTVSNWECGRETPWPKEQIRVLSFLLDMAQPRPARPSIIEKINR